MFAVKGIKLCWYLIKNGLKCESVEIDKNNPTYLVYMFKKSDKLNDLMSTWQNIRY